MRKPRLPSSKRQVAKLTGLLSGRPRVLILTHNNPDPDAMAAALCLSHLVEGLRLSRARIVYGGIIGRASNREMVSALEIPLWTMESIRFRPDDVLVMLDTQPGFGNNPAPENCEVAAVIDHHPPAADLKAPLVDVREHYGAVTTIVTEYLVSAGVELTPRLATAVCYGISSETQDLGREASRADIAAFVRAFPLSHQPLLGRLHHPALSPAFFADLARAVDAARMLDDVLVCHMSNVATAETVAEMADMLIAVEGVKWVLCSSDYADHLVLSLRTSERAARAGELLRKVVGQPGLAGGHGMIAGGSIPLGADTDIDEIRQGLTRKFLGALGRGAEAELRPLVEQPGVPKKNA